MMFAAAQQQRPPNRINRNSFLNQQAQQCAPEQGGRYAFYGEQQNFTFPSCTLTYQKDIPLLSDITGDDIEVINDRTKHNIIFKRHPNLNMIVFEILIKLFDFAHDHIKSTKRIASIDANFNEILINIDQNAYADEIAGAPQKRTKIGGGASTVSDKVLRSDEDRHAKDMSTKDMSTKDSFTEDSSKFVSIPNDLKLKQDVTPAPLDEDTLIFINQMKEELSFVLTQIISFTTPKLINNVTKITDPETDDVEIMDKPDDKTDVSEATDIDIAYNDNIMLLCCFIIIINELFTTSTGGSTDDYLTRIYPDNELNRDNANNWLKIDDDELNDTNLKIKIMKLSIIQTLMQIFDMNENPFNTDETRFIKTHPVLHLFSREYFDIFFAMYFKNFVTNYKNQNAVSLSKKTLVGGGTMVGGVIDGEVLRKLNNVFTEYPGAKLPKYFNNQIFRVFTCNLLWSLDIIEKTPSADTIDTFKYTSFGQTIMDRVCNATNYSIPNPAGAAAAANDADDVLNLVPNNNSQPHPTLVVLRYQLDNLDPIWRNNRDTNFNQYKNIEHVLESTMYHYAMSIDRFRFDLPPGILKSRVPCCPSSFIMSNAATTLAVGVPIQNTKRGINVNGYDVVGRDKCTITTYAEILDPAGAPGSKSISFDEPYEYGNMNSNVVGLNFNGVQDNRVVFNGVITFTPGGPQQAAAARYCSLSNRSRNNIQLNIYSQGQNRHTNMDVRCNVNMLFLSDNYPSINGRNNTEIQRMFGRMNETAMHHGEMPTEPRNPTLAGVRRNMLFTLANDIVTMPINEPVKGARGSKLKRTAQRVRTDDLFVNYYNWTVARQEVGSERGDHINRLLSTTLNKTVGDLMQVLTVLTKYGGITELHAIHSKVFPYNDEGNALREVAHHDLTASIITYFMLIFGGYKWRINPNSLVAAPGIVAAIPGDGQMNSGSSVFQFGQPNSQYTSGPFASSAISQSGIQSGVAQSTSSLPNSQSANSVSPFFPPTNVDFPLPTSQFSTSLSSLPSGQSDSAPPLPPFFKQASIGQPDFSSQLGPSGAPIAFSSSGQMQSEVFNVGKTDKVSVGKFKKYRTPSTKLKPNPMPKPMPKPKSNTQKLSSNNDNESDDSSDRDESDNEDEDEGAAGNGNAQTLQPLPSDVSAAIANVNNANNYYGGIDDKYWITIHYYNPGKNEGGYMSDHNLVRLGVGNSDELNNVIHRMNGYLTQCGVFGHFTSLTQNIWNPPAAMQSAGSDAELGGGRKTIRRRNKVPRFTIREKKHYARKSIKYYRKKHKTRSLIGA